AQPGPEVRDQQPDQKLDVQYRPDLYLLLKGWHRNRGETAVKHIIHSTDQHCGLRGRGQNKAPSPAPQFARAAMVIQLVIVLFWSPMAECFAQGIRVNPTGFNVNSQGATTVFLTFGNLKD